MKVTVCQIDANNIESEWEQLREHREAEQSEFVLLPEMIFAPWFAATPDVDAAVWDEGVARHEAWTQRLGELGADMVAGSMPMNRDGKRLNVGYLWTESAGLTLTHTKTYLPDDEGFWEATWYDRGTVDFQAVTAHNVRFGYMICTEIWFMQHIREYGQQGTHFILCPRSTPLPTNDKWLACGRTAGVIGGGFCLSSNHAGAVMGMELGGTGWITDPESVVLGVTSAEQPFITVDVDLSQAEAAKATYPRYVIDSPL